MGLSASRTLDDQRRRRLVMESDFDGPARGVTWSTRVDLAEADESSLPPRLAVSLADYIPSKIWAYWAFGGVACVAPISILLAWLFAEEAAASGSMVADKVVFLSNRLLNITGALSWWLAGQLSCLVWWGRSRSRVDYSGRFHAWGWAAAGFAVAGLLAVVGAQQLAAVLLDVLGGNSAISSGGVTAIWLLPSIVVGLAFWATLGIELRGCLASRILHGIAGVCGLTFVGIELWLNRADATMTLECGSRLSLALMQCCNLMTVLLQVHHVVHVSADPSEATPTLLSVAWQHGPVRLISWLRLKVRRQSRFGSVSDTTSGVVSDTDQVAELATGNDRKKRRVRLEAPDGTTQEVRIDDAEQLAKGPSRRGRQVARKS